MRSVTPDLDPSQAIDEEPSRKMRETCNACQAAKIGCGHQRPRCARCEKHGLVCIYSMSLPLGRPAKNKVKRSRPVSGEQMRGLRSCSANRVVRQEKDTRESRRRLQPSLRVSRDSVSSHRSDSSVEEVTSEVGDLKVPGCTDVTAVGFFETGDPIGDWILEQECAIARGAGPVDYSGLFHNLTFENRSIPKNPTFQSGFKPLCIPWTRFPIQNQGLPALGHMADSSLTIHIVDRGLAFANIAAPMTESRAYFPALLCTPGTPIANEDEAFYPMQDPWRVPGMPPSNFFSGPMDTCSMDQSLSSGESDTESLSEGASSLRCDCHELASSEVVRAVESKSTRRMLFHLGRVQHQAERILECPFCSVSKSRANVFILIVMAIDTVLPILEMTATSASVDVDGEVRSARGEVVDLSQSRACLSNLSFVVRQIYKVLLSASPSDGQLALADETDRRLRLIIQSIE
ncbi:hypothetical protein N7508_006017 [Penicillium antarcticum]|uniref:uncharacterized protein n=1 Tax=Penicillium antarcticum TaxID=416450 RepID=UPI0023971D11|nr:uncharacterized protein N7508_006017 [Penicillium antarcticum]KAJ5307002.1 hypothetical protein N7508_006017 [Penicillium antarcticum]